MDKIVKDISGIIKSFQKQMTKHLPGLEMEVQAIINQKSKDRNKIENMLDSILSLTDIGIGDELFVKLLEYYKTVSAKGAEFYWNEYDKTEEE